MLRFEGGVLFFAFISFAFIHVIICSWETETKTATEGQYKDGHGRRSAYILSDTLM
jgi:hypothetical protein